MKEARLLWQDYRYFPYERMLARREASRHFGCTLDEDERGLTVPQDDPQALRAAEGLTYFKAVEIPEGDARADSDETGGVGQRERLLLGPIT